MTKTVQELAPEILGKIKKARTVLLHLHPRPDGDSIGSALAFWHMLKAMGKHPTLIQGDSSLPEGFFCMPGADAIEKKSIREVDLSAFDLFLIVDSAQIRLVSDSDNISFPPSLETVVIDHHISNTKFAKLNLVDSTYSATAHIVYDLFKIWEVNISEKIAQCLYVGMWTDTNGFQYRTTNADALRAAADLIDITPKVLDAVFLVLNNNAPQHIAFQGLALSNVRTFFEGRVAISFVTSQQLKEKNIEGSYTENQGISSILRSVKRWDIAISFVEMEPDRIAVSVRTRNNSIDASKITAQLGGGGHKAAAGATLHMPFDQAREKLLEAIGVVIKEK